MLRLMFWYFNIVYPNGVVVQFGYNGLGRRVFRQEGSNVRYFYYDGDKIIAEREGSLWVVPYLLGLKPCDYVVSGQVRVYHADRLGSVRWVTDGSGNLVASYVYEGFGKIVGQGGSEVVPYRFCGLWGYRNDGDAGLLHVGARYYEVEIGRWVQKDLIMGSILYPLSLNGYSYVVNNPILFVDPQGLTGWATLICFVLGTIIGAIIGGNGGLPGIGVGAATGAAIGLFIGGIIDAIITYYTIKSEMEKLNPLIEKQEKSAGVDVERVYEKRL